MQDFIYKGEHIHLVGIKGTGMSALAELLVALGSYVTGSDVADVFYTDEIIKRLGIECKPFSRENITGNEYCVIHSSAYNTQTNSDLIAAKEKGVPILLYTEALGLFSATAYSVGVCGVHGKTSTTGLIGTILSKLPLSSGALAGSIISSFGTAPVHSCVMMTRSFCDGCRLQDRQKAVDCPEQSEQSTTEQSTTEGVERNGVVECPEQSQTGGVERLGAGSLNKMKRYFVAETCEYQRHFMSFHPQKIVLTSVESDHQDYYPTYNDILSAFVDYLCLLPKGGQVIYCADDKGAVEAVQNAIKRRSDLRLTPYGFTATGDYRIMNAECRPKEGAQHFDLGCISGIVLNVPGSHEVLDAAAAVAAAEALLTEDGLDARDYMDAIREGVSSFAGGKRRSEVVSRRVIGGNDTIFIDDYAHHPTAIATTLAGYRQFYAGRRIVVDFMSHTYTRTAALLDEFAASFGDADDVIINKIYGSAREDASSMEAAGVTGKMLAERAKMHHKHVVYAEQFDEAAKIGREILSQMPMRQYPNGCLFVTMGAGDNYLVGKLIYQGGN